MVSNVFVFWFLSVKVGLDAENGCALYSLILDHASGFVVMMKLFWTVNEFAKLCQINAQVARTINHYRKNQSNMQIENCQIT